MSLLDTLITLKAVEFDTLRGLFTPIEGTIVYLLQPDGQLKNYKQTDGRDGMTTGWYIVTNKYQQTRDLRIATTEADFWKVLMKSSHAAIGQYVFEINKASSMPPSEKYPYYTVSLSATAETYTP